jgi:hypothetical protein
MAAGTIFFAACASSPPTQKPVDGTPVAAPNDRSSLDRDMAALGLKKGMTGAELRQALGEPETIAPVEAPEGKAEVWTYHRKDAVGVRQVVTSVRNVPFADPLTGAMRSIQEPIYGQETVYAEEELKLLLFQDSLIEWKRTRRETRGYN